MRFCRIYGHVGGWQLEVMSALKRDTRIKDKCTTVSLHPRGPAAVAAAGADDKSLWRNQSL